MDKIIEDLKNAGYDFGIAIATEAEINAKSGCGQLAIIVEAED